MHTMTDFRLVPINIQLLKEVDLTYESHRITLSSFFNMIRKPWIGLCGMEARNDASEIKCNVKFCGHICVGLFKK